MAAKRTDLPTIEGESRAFWDALNEQRLTIGSCNSCGKVHYYPRPFCPHCWSDDVGLVEASGEGTLYTFSVVHMNDLPPFNEQVPYVAAMVDLAEGVRVTTNIVGCEPDALEIGMKLTVDFESIDDGVTKAVFRPA